MPREEGVEVAPDDVVLRGEVAEEGPAGDAGGGGDVVEGRLGEPVADEQVEGDLLELGPARDRRAARVGGRRAPLYYCTRVQLICTHDQARCLHRPRDPAPCTDDVAPRGGRADRGGPARRGRVHRRHVRRLLTVPPPCSTGPGTWRPQVSVRPEAFGALLYHFGTRRLSFLKDRRLLDGGRRAWPRRPTARDACTARRRRAAAELPAYERALARLADDRHAAGASRDERRRAAGRALRPRPRRPDLPDLGADLRLQPGLRALPVELRAARPARADHRRGQGRHRRARADAGVLREHRRRRADHPARLLGAGRLRHRPPRRREVLHQRRQDHARGGASGWRPATTSTCRSRSTAPPPRSTTPSAARARSPPPSRAMENLAAAGLHGLQDLGRLHPAQHRPARRVQGDRRPLRRPAAAHPAAAVGPRRRRLGRAAPDRRPSSASCTTGCWPTARTCSPATRSSTWPATAKPCPG